MRTAASVAKACAPALLIAFPAVFWVAEAVWRASWATLGRDQGIFQYVAWAASRGDLLYRDIRDVNGPLVAMIHSGFASLGGGDEHRFRVLDLFFTGIAFAFVGGCLPSLGAEKEDADGLLVRASRRAAWALAAWASLTAQYVVYGFWDTAQRESFLDWFVAISIGLFATRAAVDRPHRWGLREPRARRTIAVLALSGAFAFAPWLGKPTYALFTLAQLAALLLEKAAWRVRLQRGAIFLAGGLAGLAIPLLYLALHGDLRAWARITFVDVPAMYRFIWPRTPYAILSLPGYSVTASLAITTTVGLLALVFFDRLPRRALPIAAMPALALVSVVVQAKGFPYHLHPVTFGTTLAWLAALASAWDRIGDVRSAGRIAIRVALVVVAVVLGQRALFAALRADYPDAPTARDRASLESAVHLAPYVRIDYFPRALRDAAEYVAAKTSPDDRVQTYAMDAYLLFLARRKSATPYIYAYDLNVDAALHGSFEDDGPRPDEAQRATIRAMRDAHESDLLERLERAPPAAFVFVDRSPLMSSSDAVADFAEHCPKTAFFLSTHYRQTATFDDVRVWLRNDRAESVDDR